MSTECLVQFDEEGKAIKILKREDIAGQPNVELCVVYTHEEDFINNRVQSNCSQVAQFAGKLIGDLGLRIPHPEFYPDEYAKFEKEWAEFTKHAKDHLRIIELLKRGFGCIYDILDSNQPVDTGPLDGVADDLRKLGVLK